MLWNKYKANKVRVLHPIICIYAGVFVLLVAIVTVATSEIRTSKKEDQSKIFFDSLPIKAKAVYVYDIKEDKTIYAKNEHTPLPLASITKVMSVYCALKNVSDLNKYVSVPQNIFDPNVSTTSPENFESWTIYDLASYILVKSSNLGSEILAKNTLGEEETVRCMNEEVEKMGLFETKFFNVSGLDIDIERSGAYGSAENVSVLFQNVYKEYPEILGKTIYPSYELLSQNGIMRNASNTNIVTGEITGLLASKTGFTDLSGGNLAFMMNAGLDHKVMIVILGSTQEERFTDALTISSAVIESFAR